MIVATSMALLAMAAPALGLHFGASETLAYGTTSSPGRAAADITDASLPSGPFRPVVVLSAARGSAALAPQPAGVRGVASVMQVSDPAWTKDGTNLALVVTQANPASDGGSAVVEQVRALGQRCRCSQWRDCSRRR